MTTALFCTKCGKKAAEGDLFCAQCGNSLTAATEDAPKAAAKPRRSLKQELAQIQGVGFWVALFVTLPTLSLPTVLVKVIAPGMMDAADAQSIWNVLVLTAPLTASLVIVILAIHYDWFDNGWVLMLFGAGLLTVTTLIANALSIGGGVDPGAVWQAVGYQPFRFFEGLLVSYYQLYGFWSFASSIVVGGFIAWLWIDKIVPNLLTTSKGK
ncbi:MAG: hypothetical protein KF893_25750 [Caldilineaceae bacterium]|nr:hypothetical protein [Caldilineaceae bacterium]